MSLLLRLRRYRAGLPAPRISQEQAVELATIAWDQNGRDGGGPLSNSHSFPIVREKLDEYAITFGVEKVTNMVFSISTTVYHVNNQSGEVYIEVIDRLERIQKERERLLLRSATGSADTLLRPTENLHSNPEALMQSCEGDPTQGDTGA